MLNNKTILITGGTGSFGHKFVEMIFDKYMPNRLIIYSRDEFKQYEMSKKFKSILTAEQFNRLRFFIGDVRDKDRLYRAFEDVDYVIHAAAMKQVPTCEYNPFEAVLTNIHGAKNVIDAAIDKRINKVIALSTDKAVNPVNLYGGTKLVSDKLFVAANAYSGNEGTKFSVVRYGNVANSRGSVIPLFNRIISDGKKELPITDVEMTRFWITLNKGVELVLFALENSFGGETYISKIPSFRITDLAKAIGGSEIKLDYIGIRPGEKLHEIMIPKEEARLAREFEEYYIIYPNFEWRDNMEFYQSKGKKLPDGFEYSSDKNNMWLSKDELINEIKNINV